MKGKRQKLKMYKNIREVNFGSDLRTVHWLEQKDTKL